MPISKLASYAALLAVPLLTACKDEVVPTAIEQAAADDGIEMVPCAIGEGSQIGPDCTVERIEGGEFPILMVRHADGGFRRFEQLDDGRGLRAADGADEARLSLDGDVLVVEVSEDTYRFPATVSGRTDAGE